MPELPEVHTTVEGLKKSVIGKTIKDVWSDFHVGSVHGGRRNIKNKKYFEEFRNKVRGSKIMSIERWGKNILINLDNSQTILVHMKMTGHFLTQNFEKEKKFIHLSFGLSGGSSKKTDRLAFSDIRKFASVEICSTEDVHRHERVGSLGIDALAVRSKKFVSILGSKNAPIKAALMDQSAIAGLGNIYSDEMLWQAGVHPSSIAQKIPPKKLLEIFRAMRRLLKLSIKHGGDSKSDYRNVLGEKGNFQNFHKAYGQKGNKCSKRGCSGIISKMTIRGRSASYCPTHQTAYK